MELDILAYIQAKIPELKDRVYPVFTEDVKGLSLVYTFSPVGNAGTLSQDMLSVKVIHKDYDTCKEFEVKLKEILNVKDHEPYVKTGNTYFRSEVSGGGTIFNQGVSMYETSIYFIIKWR